MSSMLGGAGAGPSASTLGALGGNIPAGGIGGAPSDLDMYGMASMAGGFKSVNDFATSLGDSPDERTKNAQAFASLVASLGKMGKDVGQSTLLQRMMKGRIRPIAELNTGQASGGVAAIPTLAPGTAQSIMSQMGYK